MSYLSRFWLAVGSILLHIIKGDKHLTKTPITPIMESESPIIPKLKTEPQMNEKIYNFAKSCLRKDIAATQSELGCAEAVSFILNGVQTPNFPLRGFLSTADLYRWLQQFATPSNGAPGDIIISPTGTSSKGSSHGHVGIVAYHGILSNNSMTGLFDEYYTLDRWEAYYKEKLGFPVLFFKI